MTDNIFVGYFIGGIGFALCILAVFQIGLNIGIRTSINMLEEYPAASKFLKKNKKTAHIMPYIIENKESVS